MNHPNRMPESLKKEKLFMIHGLLGALDSLQHVESLINAAEARTAHLLGYGNYHHSSTTGITLAAQAKHVSAWIDKQGLQKCWLLGHSVGGAVAMFLADQRPELVQAVINVEGNFTLKDAFWSSRIATMTPEQWAAEFAVMQSDSVAWLKQNHIDPNPQNINWATSMLQREQPAATIHNMAKAVIAATSPPEYLEMIRRVFDRTPVHLVAGEKSTDGWDAPEWARSKAASCTEIPQTGHMMMLEDPAAFSRCIDSIQLGHTAKQA